MAYKIERQIIPGLHQGELIASNFVVAHESGNPNNTGPDALENEIRYMRNNHQNAFTSHWVGDGGRIVQIAEAGKFQYGAGPYANPYSYAHVELARTDNAATFKKDYAAYIWLLRKLADDAGIPKNLDTGSKVSDKGIKSHDWIRKNIGGTTHTDPYAYLANFGISKAQFKKDIEAGTASKPTEPKQPETPKQSPNKTTSIVDYLKSIGEDSSFANRSKLAKQHGISNYTGTAAQNTLLLNKLRSDKASKRENTAKKGDQQTTSIVDYLKSIGVDSSFANRKKLASQHGINNYTGTASQNTKLLNKLRG